MPEIAFTIVLFLGLVAITWWQLRPLKVQEGRTDDGLEELWAPPAADRDGAQ